MQLNIPNPLYAEIDEGKRNYRIEDIDFDGLAQDYGPTQSNYIYNRSRELAQLKEMGVPDDFLDLIAEESLKRKNECIFVWAKDFLKEEKKKRCC